MPTNTRRTALITGASRGLGLALAQNLAQAGWSLILTARNADQLARACAQLPGSPTLLAGDVASPEHRSELERAAARLGGLSLLVNNASALGPSPLPALLDYPLDQLEAVVRTNLIAPLGVIQSLRGQLRADARILNITSDAAVEAYPGWGGYGASKAALDQLSAVLAAELPGMRVYAVDPGDMRTQMHQDAFPGEDISDRLPPEASLPGLRALIEGDLPSGRYRARELVAAQEQAV